MEQINGKDYDGAVTSVSGFGKWLIPSKGSFYGIRGAGKEYESTFKTDSVIVYQPHFCPLPYCLRRVCGGGCALVPIFCGGLTERWNSTVPGEMYTKLGWTFAKLKLDVGLWIPSAFASSSYPCFGSAFADVNPPVRTSSGQFKNGILSVIQPTISMSTAKLGKIVRGVLAGVDTRDNKSAAIDLSFLKACGDDIIESASNIGTTVCSVEYTEPYMIPSSPMVHIDGVQVGDKRTQMVYSANGGESYSQIFEYGVLGLEGIKNKIWAYADGGPYLKTKYPISHGVFFSYCAELQATSTSKHDELIIPVRIVAPPTLSATSTGSIKLCAKILSNVYAPYHVSSYVIVTDFFIEDDAAEGVIGAFVVGGIKQDENGGYYSHSVSYPIDICGTNYGGTVPNTGRGVEGPLLPFVFEKSLVSESSVSHEVTVPCKYSVTGDKIITSTWIGTLFSTCNSTSTSVQQTSSSSEMWPAIAIQAEAVGSFPGTEQQISLVASCSIEYGGYNANQIAHVIAYADIVNPGGESTQDAENNIPNSTSTYSTLQYHFSVDAYGIEEYEYANRLT